MNCAKRVVTVLFLFGMTFTSFIPIEARQNLKVAGVDNGCLIADGSVGATAPLPRLSLGSCDEDYTLDVEFDYYYQYESEAYGLRIGDSSGDIGCMSYDGDWLAADVCLETPNFNQLWRLTMDWSGTSATTEIGNGKLGNHFDSLCVQYIPDAETGENLKMIDCNVVTTIFLLVDAPLVDAPFDCSADYNATKPIDNFELQTVGVLAPDENQTEVPSPVRVYLNDGGMTVHLFYEGHPDHVTDTNTIDVTLYAMEGGIMPSPCGGNGEALSSTLYDVTLVSYNDDNYNGFFKPLDASQCFPRTTNGVVAQAEIVMTENPFDPNLSLAPLIYDNSENSGATNDGLLQFCARVAYSVGDELVSFIDSRLVLDVSIAADIEFTQEVAISSDQTVNIVNQDIATVIDVDSFLCGDPNENDGTPYAEDYSLGQSFRVCVDVKAADRDKFGLTNFKDVKCSTASDETTIDRRFGMETIIVSLVNDVATATSILTSLFDNEATVGAKSVASGTPSTQIVASERAISFSTVVTNAYLTGDADTLTCSGSVDVETVSASPVQEYCDQMAIDSEEYRGDNTMTYNEVFEVCCKFEVCGVNCDTCLEDVVGGGGVGACPNDVVDFGMVIDNLQVCIVPDQDSRRQLVSFTVPNPMASSSASSRRRMDEETGAAVAGATADFGAIIKLSSSSSSSSSSGPFLLLLWATTTTLLLLSAGWSL